MQKGMKVVAGVTFIVYVLALVSILFMGTRGYAFSETSLVEYIRKSSNIVPFKTISTYVTAIVDESMNMDIPIKNLFGNVILFFPMGIYLPFFLKKANKVSIFAISMTLLLFVIEFVQVVTRRGRFDIDDFILNMLGAFIGFAIWRSNFVKKYIGRTTYSSGL
ncbi:VanZ family protein [Pontibacillus sp. ALD_SL1]|uniref:VanZ family protein n=1 Tax=Pontibacillus sp. ALD_SL1 TaxID=2777185 RepID=UPI001A973B72|nr:VanZ family protein [Pontibacillus sp. ALD_SL1]QSS98680.1 VanZ family protein [Pontibacillus sp. ALD_SL1]